MTEHEEDDGFDEGFVEGLDDVTKLAAAMLLIDALDRYDDSDNAEQLAAKRVQAPSRWNPRLPQWLSWVIVICMWLVFAMVFLFYSSWW